MKEVFSNSYKGDQEAIREFIRGFTTSGISFDKRNRNSLRLFDLNGRTINIKSFKKPHLFNRFIYRYLRASKAQRSFEYAHRLLEHSIGTPEPIAYFEETSVLGLGKSFYVSEHLDYDMTYRELVRDSTYAGNEALLTAFGKFTHKLHSNGIHFLDHSVGNTLIVLKDGNPSFYLVDLNRMKFGKLNFTTRMKNFERLSKIPLQIKYMARGYAEESGEDENKIYNTISQFTMAYQDKFYRKKRWKKRLKI